MGYLFNPHFSTATVMILRFIIVVMGVLLLESCQNKKTTPTKKDSTTTAVATKNASPHLTTDTLQFIHFDGNGDYWSAVFIDDRKDTLTLVIDIVIPNKFKNKLFEVKWFTDTLYEAGDGDRKYAAKRISHFRVLNGKPFVTPITEQQIINDVKNIPEVQSGADQVGIAERPTEEKPYYLIETGTHGEDNYSRFQMFRVYLYPKYEIRVYDPSTATDLSLNQWRQRNQ